MPTHSGERPRIARTCTPHPHPRACTRFPLTVHPSHPRPTRLQSKALEEKDRLAKETEELKKLDAERVEQRVADMKQKAREAQEAQEAQLMRKASFDLEQININLIGFMPLKKLLMERGVPKEQVFSAANKFALQEVANKWADELKIEWVTE